MKSSFNHRFQFALALAIISGYLLSRLTNLGIFPIFTDEAIYVRWIQIGANDAAWRFIPLTDGKPPLFHWLAMVSIQLFSDPLLATRLVSVLAGLANVILIGILAYLLFNHKKIAFLSSVFYLTSPFALVYDRLAIVDSLLTTFSLSSLIFAVLLTKTRRLDTALLFGASVGAGMLTKASGLIFLLLSPATVILARFDRHRLFRQLFSWLGLFLIAAFVSQMVYSILRLSEFFYRIGQKNSEFIISFSQFLQSPFSMTWGNLKSLVLWQIGYLTIPVTILVILAFFFRHSYKPKLLLAFYWLAPLLMIASFNKIIFPRFLLFSFPFLLILAASGFHHLSRVVRSTMARFLLFVLIIAIPAATSITLIHNPLQAHIPQADRDQYLDSWPAGWGIPEIVSHLKSIADTTPIYVGTQGTFGLMPYALEIYLHRHPNVEIHSFWPVDFVPQEVLQAARGKTTYFIYNELEDIPPQDYLELVMEFKKTRGDETRHLRLFRVNPGSD